MGRGGGGIHYGSGGCNVQMARCYGGKHPTLQQSQLSSPAHLDPAPARTWSHTGLVKRREEEEEEGVMGREMLP